jgi:hypothetical protein
VNFGSAGDDGASGAQPPNTTTVFIVFLPICLESSGRFGGIARHAYKFKVDK